MVRFSSPTFDSDNGLNYSPTGSFLAENGAAAGKLPAWHAGGSASGTIETPEEMLQRRPYAGVGKTSLSLYEGRQPVAYAPTPSPVTPPSVEEIMAGQPQPHEKNFVESAGDWLTYFTQAIQPLMAPGIGIAAVTGRRQIEMSQAWDNALTSDDPVVRNLATQWQQKSLSNEVDANTAMSSFYEQYNRVKAIRSGESAYLADTLQYKTPQELMHGDPGQVAGQLLGQATIPLRVLQAGVVRTASTGFNLPFLQTADRIKETLAEYDQPDHGRLTEGLVQYAEEYKKGQITDDEFRDLIITEGFALTNPEPMGKGKWWLNMPVSLGLELISDPLTLPTVGAGSLAKVGGMAATRLVPNVLRVVGEDAVASAARAAGKETAEFAATAAGKEVAASASARASAELERLTSELKGASTKSLRDMDYIDGLRELAAQPEYASAVERGLGETPWLSKIATRAPSIVRTGRAIDAALDPLTLTGRTLGAARARLATSHLFAEGLYDAFGWLNVDGAQRAMRGAGLSQDTIDTLTGRAAANHARQIGNNTVMRRMRLFGLADPTRSASDLVNEAVERRGADVRGLMARQVDQTSEFISPRARGGRQAEEDLWRDQTAQMLTDMGATGDVKAAVAGMNEGQMRYVRHLNWSHMIEVVDKAKQMAMPTPKFSDDLIDRVTYMGPRQMDETARQELVSAVKRGDVAAVRQGIERFDDLRVNLEGLALEDADLLARAGELLDALEGKVPQTLKDSADLPTALRDFLTTYGDRGYQLGLRPADDDLAQVIKNAAGDVIGVRSWVDNVVDATPAREIGRVRGIMSDLTRGITADSIERNAGRRFIQNMQGTIGMPEQAARDVLRNVKRIANEAETTPRGLTIGQMERAVRETKSLDPLMRGETQRYVVDAILSAYQNELRLVGATQALTGSMKVLAGSFNNWAGVFAENIYPKIRFAWSPVFVAQEITELPFFLALRGQYPVRAVIGRRTRGALFAGHTMEHEVLQEKTRFLMDYFHANGNFVDGDMIEQSDLVRRGFKAAERIANRQTAIGRWTEATIQRLNHLWDHAARKEEGELVVFRNRMGEEWKKSLLEESPMTWYAARANYPKELNDGEFTINWLHDLVARSDPDAVYTKMGASLYQPGNLGRQATFSPSLVGSVLGDQTLTRAQLRARIRDTADDLDFPYIENTLRGMGADEDYIERARWMLDGPDAGEFTQGMIDNGVSEGQARGFRESLALEAQRRGIGMDELLAHEWADAPQSIDQFGDQKGTHAFQLIVDAMEARGLTAPERDSPLIGRLNEAGQKMTVDWQSFNVPAGETADRAARSKVVGWEGARARRAADPSLGRPPEVEGGRGARHAYGQITPQQWLAQVNSTFDEATQRENADWYTDMQRGFLALFSDLPEDQQVEKAARLIVSFGVTQLNTSPALGMEFLYRVMSMAKRGEDWPSVLGLTKREAEQVKMAGGGLNFSQLEELLFDQRSGRATPYQLGQKLADFIDSLIGREDRSVGIPGPNPERPWGPVAGDVWAKRDAGYVDPKIADRMWQTVDGGASSSMVGDEIHVLNSNGQTILRVPKEAIGESQPTDLEYDYIVEFYNSIADHLNEVNYLERHWTPADAQAMGWFRAKRAFGDATGDPRAAFYKGRWMGASEVNPVAGTRYADLLPDPEDISPEAMEMISDRIAHEAHRAALEDSGVMSPRMVVPGGRNTIEGSHINGRGEVVSAPVVEILGDRSAARQYAARVGLNAQMDEVVLIRDTKVPAFDYANAKGRGNVGGVVRVMVEGPEQGRALMDAIAAGDVPTFPRGAHLAQADGGEWMVQGLWDPGAGKADGGTFNRATKPVEAEVGRVLPGATVERGPAEFIRLTNDWSTHTDGQGYLDVIESPGFAVSKFGERPATPRPEAAQLARDRVSRLTHGAEGIIQQTVPREAAARRTGDLFGGPIPGGDHTTVVGADDLLRSGTGVHYQRAPAGTRAAIVAGDRGRSQLYFGGARVTPDSLIHELAHKAAFAYDPSAIRRIKGVKAGLEGSRPGSARGKWATRLTEAEHEWVANQYSLWAADPNSVHPTMQPLMAALRDEIDASTTGRLAREGTSPATQRVTTAKAAVDAAVAAGAPAAEVRALRATLKEARAAEKELRATGGLSPEMKSFFDEQAALAKRKDTSASYFDRDEDLLFQHIQAITDRSARAAKDLVHFKSSRSVIERSINHPFFGMYPYSYMHGKVLPELVEFLMFRPFGFKTPLLTFDVTNRMYQSFMNQQEHDEDLRRFLYENEPAFRTLSMFVPGTPWDLPVNMPLVARRLLEGHLTNEQRIAEGKEPLNIDPGKIISDTVGYQFGVGRAPQTFGDTIEGLTKLPELLGAMAQGEAPTPDGEGFDVGGPFTDTPANTEPAPQSSATVPSAGAVEMPAASGATVQDINEGVNAQIDLLLQQMQPRP